MPIILVIFLFVAAGTTAVIVTFPLTERVDPAVTQAQIANETDPLTSLSSTVPSTRWGQAYWAEQAKAQTWIFPAAKAICGNPDYKDSPNCKTVKLVAWLTAPREPVPKYGSRGGFGKVPTVGAGQ